MRAKKVRKQYPKLDPLSEALKKIEVPDVLVKVSDMPKITPVLEQLGTKNRWLKQVMTYLRGSNQPEAALILLRYDAMTPKQQKIVPFEAYCVEIKGGTARVMEVITRSVFEQSAVASNLLAAAAHPAVVRATVTAAKNPKYGSNDRKMLHLASGFIPVPKNQATFIGNGGVGSVITNNNQSVEFNNQNNAHVIEFSAGEVIGVEQRLLKAATRFNERMGIEQDVAPPVIVDAADPMQDAEVEHEESGDWSFDEA